MKLKNVEEIVQIARNEAERNHMEESDVAALAVALARAEVAHVLLGDPDAKETLSALGDEEAREAFLGAVADLALVEEALKTEMTIAVQVDLNQEGTWRKWGLLKIAGEKRMYEPGSGHSMFSDLAASISPMCLNGQHIVRLRKGLDVIHNWQGGNRIRFTLAMEQPVASGAS